MLTLQLPEEEIKVKFKFAEREDGIRTTTCEMFDSQKNCLVESVASCNPKDHFSRVEGRKYAFNKAVWSLSWAMFGVAPYQNYSLNIRDEDVPLSKKWRKEMWNAYFALPMKTR